MVDTLYESDNTTMLNK